MDEEVKKQNNYDGVSILREIKSDISKQKNMIFLSGFTFFVLLMIMLPIAFWLLFGLLFYADLPFFDHGLIRMAQNTKFFLLPYTILLVFYFIVMYHKDKSLHITNEKHFIKAKKYFIVSLIIAVFPYVFSNHMFLTVSYFFFFILTIYNLSETYYDVPLAKANNIHSHLYGAEDLGWLSSHGMVDNPFSIKDDMNRGRLFVQTSTIGFDFIVLFIDMIVKSFVFTYAVGSKRYTQESARLFDSILDHNLEMDYMKYSISSKIILESLSYVSFRNGVIVLYERGEEIEKLSKIKENK